jgi:hypothetical protein
MPRSSHRRLQRTGYPASWPRVCLKVQQAASFQCGRCGQSHNPKVGHRLQVHPLDRNKANLAEWNLVPLCRPCRLVVQAMGDWAQGRFFPVEDWLIPYRITYLATQGITEPWLGALGGRETLSPIDDGLVVEPPPSPATPISDELGLRSSLKRLMGPAIYVEGAGDSWLAVYQHDGDYLVFRLGSQDNGDYFGHYHLLEAAKKCIREIKEGVITEPQVHLEGSRLPWWSSYGKVGQRS